MALFLRETKQNKSAHINFVLNNFICLSLVKCSSHWPPLWSSGQRSGFDSRSYKIFWEVVFLERGPLSLVSTTEEILGRKSSGSDLGNRDCGRKGSTALTKPHPSICKSWQLAFAPGLRPRSFFVFFTAKFGFKLSILNILMVGKYFCEHGN
jgi:hypothetical protein